MTDRSVIYGLCQIHEPNPRTGPAETGQSPARRRPQPPRPHHRRSHRPSPLPAAPPARRSGAQAIIEAALDEFIARGFAATRLDDVAKRAGVAKGTIYLHFKDKEALFQELVRTALVPLIGRLTRRRRPADRSATCSKDLRRTFVQEVATTRRGDIVRLIMAEGPRFPASPISTTARWWRAASPGLRALIEAAIARGEIRNEALARFPQLVVAPGHRRGDLARACSASMRRWTRSEMLRVHLDLIFGERRTT